MPMSHKGTPQFESYRKVLPRFSLSRKLSHVNHELRATSMAHKTGTVVRTATERSTAAHTVSLRSREAFFIENI